LKNPLTDYGTILSNPLAIRYVAKSMHQIGLNLLLSFNMWSMRNTLQLKPKASRQWSRVPKTLGTPHGITQRLGKERASASFSNARRLIG
jgi:hypothetical protein